MTDNSVEYMFAYVSVDSTERVVEVVYRSSAVYGSS